MKECLGCPLYWNSSTSACMICSFFRPEINMAISPVDDDMHYEVVHAMISAFDRSIFIFYLDTSSVLNQGTSWDNKLTNHGKLHQFDHTYYSLSALYCGNYSHNITCAS